MRWVVALRLFVLRRELMRALEEEGDKAGDEANSDQGNHPSHVYNVQWQALGRTRRAELQASCVEFLDRLRECLVVKRWRL